MTPEEMFQLWSPPESKWSPWVKPMLFAQTDRYFGEPDVREYNELSWLPPARRLPATAIIVDLPGILSLMMGMTLAHQGYRPIPLYNAVMGSLAVNDLTPLIANLHPATTMLQKMSFRPDAPPAFLIDANRNRNRASPGQFDNNAVLFPQDFPSADFLKGQQIGEILLIAAPNLSTDDDLRHVLLRYQQANITILRKKIDTTEPPMPYPVTQPSLFRNACYRAMVLFGMRPNSAGGFGGLVPVPSSSHG